MFKQKTLVFRQRSAGPHCFLVDPPNNKLESSLQLSGLMHGGERANIPYSVMIRSAHSTSDTKTAGVPNFAPHWFKSASVTPRVREQAPQEKIGMCLATIFSRVPLNGGHPN